MSIYEDAVMAMYGVGLHLDGFNPWRAAEVRPTSSPVRKTWKDAGRPKPPPKGGK